MLNVSEIAKKTIHSDRHNIDMWVSFDTNADFDLYSDDIKADSLVLEESVCGSSNFTLGGANISSFEVQFSRGSAIGDADIDGYLFTPYLVIPLLDDDGNPIPYKSGVTSTIINNGIYIDETFTMPSYATPGEAGCKLMRGMVTVKSFDNLNPGDTVRFKTYLQDVTPDEYICISGWNSRTSPTWEEDLKDSQQCELIPLGRFKVESCSIDSSSDLRKLKAYDLLYSTELDAEITYSEGTVVTIADLLEKAYAAIGQTFTAPYEEIPLTQRYGETSTGNTYTFTAPNGCQTEICLESTKVYLDEADITQEHRFEWSGLTDDDGELTLIDKILDYYGILGNKNYDAWSSAYHSENTSDIGYLRDNAQAIFRPELNIISDETGKYVNIPSIKYATSDGYTQISTESYEYGVDKVQLDAIVPTAPVWSRGTTVGMHIDSITRSELITILDTTTPLDYRSIGRSLKPYIRYGTLVFTSGTIDNKRIYFNRWTDTIADQILEQFKEKNLCDSDGTFYEIVDEQSYNRVVLAYTNKMHEYMDSHYSKIQLDDGWVYDIGFWTEWSWKEQGAVMTSYAGFAHDFPLEIYIEGLGSFGIKLDGSIVFGQEFDLQTGNTWWGPDAPLKRVIEKQYPDRIAGLSYVTDEEVTFTPREILQAYAELQGVFFSLDRYGNPRFINIRNNTLYPAEDLYPEDTPPLDQLYPEDLTAHDYTENETRKFSMYITNPWSYKGFRFELKNGWTEPTIRGTGTKIYDCSNVITTNFTIVDEADPGDDALIKIGNNLWNALETLTLMNADITVSGSPWIECGDRVFVSDLNRSADVLVVDRQLQGINKITDNFYHKFKK